MEKSAAGSSAKRERDEAIQAVMSDRDRLMRGGAAYSGKEPPEKTVDLEALFGDGQSKTKKAKKAKAKKAKAKKAEAEAKDDTKVDKGLCPEHQYPIVLTGGRCLACPVPHK